MTTATADKLEQARFLDSFVELVSSPVSPCILFFVFCFTLVLAVIDIQNRSQANHIKSIANFWAFVYLLIFYLGNYFSAIAFLVPFRDMMQNLSPWGVGFFGSFFGIFAFKGIISNLDITFNKKGILTIESWIEIALNNAVQKTVLNESDISFAIADKLQTLADADLNTFLSSASENDVGYVRRLETAALASGSDLKLYKALELARKYPKLARQILAARKL